MKTTAPAKKLNAYCIRTAMIGGGTSYSVYFRTEDKPTHPLHRNGSYATTIESSFGKRRLSFFEPKDAIAPRSWWGMELGWDKYEQGQRLERVAQRFAFRIAKRAFPELKALKKLPTLWANWDLPSAEAKVSVSAALPE